jgi:hypothetical protein
MVCTLRWEESNWMKEKDSLVQLTRQRVQKLTQRWSEFQTKSCVTFKKNVEKKIYIN